MTFPSGRRAARFTSPEAVQRATYFPLAPLWRCSARRCQIRHRAISQSTSGLSRNRSLWAMHLHVSI